MGNVWGDVMNARLIRREVALHVLRQHQPHLTPEQHRRLLPVVLACFDALQAGAKPIHLLQAAAAVYDDLKLQQHDQFETTEQE